MTEMTEVTWSSRRLCGSSGAKNPSWALTVACTIRTATIRSTVTAMLTALSTSRRGRRTASRTPSSSVAGRWADSAVIAGAGPGFPAPRPAGPERCWCERRGRPGRP